MAKQNFKTGDRVTALSTTGGVTKGKTYTVSRYSQGDNTFALVLQENNSRVDQSNFQPAEGAAKGFVPGQKVRALNNIGTLRAGDTTTFERLSTVYPTKGYFAGAPGRSDLSNFAELAAPVAAPAEAPNRLAKVFAAVEKALANGDATVTITQSGNKVTVAPASSTRTKTIAL